MSDGERPSPQERLRNFVSKYLPKIRDYYQPTEVWLWGSHAYGEPHEYSDIDIIVVSDRFTGDWALAERAIELAKRVGLDFRREIGTVEVICYRPEEFERQRNRITIVAEGIKKGKRLL